MKLNETKWNYPNKLFSPFTIDETTASLHACEPLPPDELPDDLGRLVHRWKMQTNRKEPCKTLAYLMISWMEPMEPCCFFPLLVWHRHFRNLKITQCANWLASLFLDAGDRSSMPLAELLQLQISVGALRNQIWNQRKSASVSAPGCIVLVGANPPSNNRQHQDGHSEL